MRICIDITAAEVEALAPLAENREISSFVDKVLRAVDKTSAETIKEANLIREINPYSSCGS